MKGSHIDTSGGINVLYVEAAQYRIKEDPPEITLAFINDLMDAVELRGDQAQRVLEKWPEMFERVHNG